MARFKIHRGTIAEEQADGSRKILGVGDEIEMDHETGLRLARMLTPIDGGRVDVIEVETGSETEEVVDEQQIGGASNDWPHVLKSSSVSKVLLLIKSINDRSDLSALLSAEQSGQNRAKIIEAVNTRMTIAGVAS